MIHVVGEPFMVGFALEFKRNYSCDTSRELRQLIPLGYVDDSNVYDPETELPTKENTPRAVLEHEATKVTPPKGGQDYRVPIDGVSSPESSRPQCL